MKQDHPCESKIRILVLGGNDANPAAACNIYAKMFAAHDVRFVEERVVSLRRFWKFSRHRSKSLGIRSLLGVYLYYVAKFIRGEKRQTKKYTPSLITSDISHDPAVEQFAAKFNPDVIILAFCGILSADFLAKFPQPTYNTHPGINPRYRGFGNIWAFYENNFSMAGYTIHLVDTGIDTGQRVAVVPVCFDNVPFEDNETHVAGLAAHHLAQFILGQAEASIPQEFAELHSVFYGLPTWFEERIMRQNYDRHRAAKTRTEHLSGQHRSNPPKDNL